MARMLLSAAAVALSGAPSAMGATIVLLLFYVVVIFADFFAYADPHDSDAQRSLIAPQTIQPHVIRASIAKFTIMQMIAVSAASARMLHLRYRIGVSIGSRGGAKNHLLACGGRLPPIANS